MPLVPALGRHRQICEFRVNPRITRAVSKRSPILEKRVERNTRVYICVHSHAHVTSAHALKSLKDVKSTIFVTSLGRRNWELQSLRCLTLFCVPSKNTRGRVFYKESMFILLIVTETQEHGASIWSAVVAPQWHKDMWWGRRSERHGRSWAPPFIFQSHQIRLIHSMFYRDEERLWL